jgi:hypothetical protein
MESGTKLVLEQIVVTLASLADSAQENFQNYYDKYENYFNISFESKLNSLTYFLRFMPCLKFIIQNATSKDLRLLRGKCIECISLIGLAVGSQKVSFDFVLNELKLKFLINY